MAGRAAHDGLRGLIDVKIIDVQVIDILIYQAAALNRTDQLDTTSGGILNILVAAIMRVGQ